jgi:hypothetical protein
MQNAAKKNHIRYKVTLKLGVKGIWYPGSVLDPKAMMFMQ